MTFWCIPQNLFLRLPIDFLMTFRTTSYYFLFVFYQFLNLLLKLSRVYVRALLLPAHKKYSNKAVPRKSTRKTILQAIQTAAVPLVPM
jgi:hypothetical protein